MERQDESVPLLAMAKWQGPPPRKNNIKQPFWKTVSARHVSPLAYTVYYVILRAYYTVMAPHAPQFIIRIYLAPRYKWPLSSQ